MKLDEDNYKILAQVVKHLQSMQDMVLTLTMSEESVLIWWVDASYTVHGEMRGYTGGTMNVGSGSMYSTSNNKS